MAKDPIQDFIIAQNIEKVKNAIAGKKVLKKPKIPRYPLALEKNYEVALRNIVLTGKKIYDNTIRNDPTFQELFRVDAESDIIDQMFDDLQLNWLSQTPDVAFMARDIGQKTSEWNDNEWRKVMKGVIGIDIFTAEPWLSDMIESFSKENAELIITLQNNTIKDIRGIVQRAYREGGRVEGITSQITTRIKQPGAYRPEQAIQDLVKKRWKAAKNHAELIARDQVSKLNGQLTRRRQTDLGISRYEWATSRDQRVRKTHNAMDRRICDWNNPTIYYNENNEVRKRSSIGGVELHPGYDYQCRCVGLPVFQDFIEEV